MLRKLLKYEFRATGRLLWIVYAAMLLLSLAANLSFRLISRPTTTSILNILGWLLIVFWGLALVIGIVMTIVLLIKRFHQNLLTDEGYLSFTLPVTPHQLVLSKLISAVVWMVVSFVVLLLCLLGSGLPNKLTGYHDVIQLSRWLLHLLATPQAALIAAEVFILLIVGIATSLLQFYSAMSIGYGFSNHKGLYSVLIYFVEYFAVNILQTLVLNCGLIAAAKSSYDWHTDSWSVTVGNHVLMEVTEMQLWSLMMLGMIVMSLILGAAFYVITVFNLKKRLNLS